MAEGLSVALPLRIDEIDGAYGLNKDIITMAEQNLKMVVLTSPGERVMEPISPIHKFKRCSGF